MDIETQNIEGSEAQGGRSRDAVRRPLTLALVVGATLFGMVLAGGFDLTPSGFAEESTATMVTVDEPVAGLPSFADLAEAVSPAVVSIQAVKIERGPRGRGGNPFEFFFGPRNQQPQERGEGQEGEPPGRRADSSGSGFVISADGLVVTNHHVIEDAEELVVFLNGREYPAEVQGDDPATDIALLKIEPEAPLAYLQLADSETVRVGDWVMAIGSPLQLNNSVSVGVVSAMGRSINITPDASLENFIQTDAAINFGNSGGPLVDLRGRVIGVATAINFGAENIGFAVPSSTLESILPQLKDSGVVRRGYLGVNITDLGFEEAEAFGYDSTDGALVTQVLPESPAGQAGIRHGDIIFKVDDRDVASNRDLIDYVASKPPKTKVRVKIFRGGDTVDATVTLGERPGVGEAPPEVVEETEGSIEWLGLQYQDISASVRENHSIPSSVDGVWVTSVRPDSPLFDKNVRPGDVIVDVNGDLIDGVEAFETAVEGVPSGKFLRFYVSRVDPRTGDVAASFFAVIRVP
ncbi:MAG: trypsin-like peptidase domain-containing protein [Acidobacteriota bacterium]